MKGTRKPKTSKEFISDSESDKEADSDKEVSKASLSKEDKMSARVKQTLSAKRRAERQLLKAQRNPGPIPEYTDGACSDFALSD